VHGGTVTYRWRRGTKGSMSCRRDPRGSREGEQVGRLQWRWQLRFEENEPSSLLEEGEEGWRVRWGALAPRGARRAKDAARAPMAEPIYRAAMAVCHAEIFLPNLDIFSFFARARSQGRLPQCGLVPTLMSGSRGAHSWWGDHAGASRRVATTVCLSPRYLEGKRESEAERL
jgi:hypothetical protein